MGVLPVPTVSERVLEVGYLRGSRGTDSYDPVGLRGGVFTGPSD